MESIFREAARSAMFAWKQDESGLEDLVNDIWVWYLERPATQSKLQKIERHEAVKTVKLAAMQMLSGNMLSANEFNGRNLYSSESVKEALLGASTNYYLNDILPEALKSLDQQNEGYAEAIRKRYEDGVRPKGAASDELRHAHKSLTEHVNIIAITAGVDAEGNVSEGPGSRNAVFPETRKGSGDNHSDPTCDLAISLVEGFKVPGEKDPVDADAPWPLCAVEMAETEKFGRVPRPIRSSDGSGRWLDSDETTTLRKEFVS